MVRRVVRPRCAFRLVHSGEERVAYDVILAASCQPRSEQQRALSATAAGPARMLPSIVTGALPCLKLHEHIRAARLAGAPFVVQSKTGDLPKVMLVLYLVGDVRRPGQHVGGRVVEVWTPRVLAVAVSVAAATLSGIGWLPACRWAR